MLNLLAQSFDTATETTLSGGETAGWAVFGSFTLLIVLASIIITVVALWKVFEKAGVEGWKAIIPIYNGWVLAEIAGKPGWWSLVSLLAWIPLIGPIAALVVYVLIALELAKRFGKDTAFAILGLIIFSTIGLLILGFGDAKYQGQPNDTLANNDRNDTKPSSNPPANTGSASGTNPPAANV